MDRPFRWAICLVIVAALLAGGCASSTPVTDAPLPAGEQQELRQTLIGTWEHTYSEEEDGEREKMDMFEITWTFNEDGTGVYHQVVPSIGQDEKNPFEWKLDGRNIHLNMETGSDDTTYRADEWDAEEMRWFNYMLSDYYIVEKR